MASEPVLCPTCGSSNVVKHGQSAAGKQRYKCRHPNCSRSTFIRHYSYRRYLGKVKQQIAAMAVNSSGIRDTARVLGVSPTTVIEELKKFLQLVPVNEAFLERLAQPQNLEVVVQRAGEAEMDEMWSFVGNKEQERWLWHVIDHQTSEILAYVLAPHVDVALKELMVLLAPFGIHRFYTDGCGVYARILDDDSHEVGKHHTQKIERKHLNLRTRIKRLARKTICFSKSERLHDTVIGLFINRYEFDRAV